MSALDDLLTDTVKRWAQIQQPALMERFVLRNSRAAQRGSELLKGIRRGKKKACFANATQLVQRGRALAPDGFEILLVTISMPAREALRLMLGGAGGYADDSQTVEDGAKP